VDQRSFYPLAPAPLGQDGAPLAMVEATRAEGLAMPRLPHLLVTPSAMPAFVKDLRAGDARVLCVNPGAASKGQCAVVSLSAAGADADRLSAEAVQA